MHTTHSELLGPSELGQVGVRGVFGVLGVNGGVSCCFIWRLREDGPVSSLAVLGSAGGTNICININNILCKN